ncbi:MULTISPECIES: helix-turn-helix transcriptional regulator [Carnobacterium]|uniref:helix-turn-helix transcriptional regulator n=1 Tax=Carnobacterium TaxID=2747 RepID=UPI002FC93C96
MIILGAKLKNARIAKGLSQKELAEGICTQATISQMENHNKVPTMSIFVDICKRLEISQAEITSDDDSEINHTIFLEVSLLCKQYKFIEAHERLTKSIKIHELKSNSNKKKYYYFLGLTYLFGLANDDEALFYFNLGLTLQSNELTVIDLLLTNGIGSVYEIKKEYEKARIYFDKSILDISKLKVPVDTILVELISLYFNTAKFYKNYQGYSIAIEFLEKGIQLSRTYSNYYLLEFILYEKGVNLYLIENKVSEEVRKLYTLAYSFSLINSNALLLEKIEQDAKNYGIQATQFF